ncbi:MAG: ParB/RepB/Spo0J family partition protein [Oscillospiraceae bacterium]|nr:ParB/RepB/Spo0J family partition protein [Oscillospiraceae bacterium]
MAKKGGLGLGLGAIFGDDFSLDMQPKQQDQDPESTILTLPIAKVEPRQDQPRQAFDQDALDELTESIRQYGLIQPITVRKLDGGFYQIIAGERRWRAARAAGLQEVPVRIIEADDRTAMELALVENLQREDLNPIEEAKGYRTLIDEYGLTQEEASAAVGKSRPAVANALRLLSLVPEVLELVEQGELSAGHARALLPIRDTQLQKDAAEMVMAKQFSVRQTEALAARLSKQPVSPPEEEKNQANIAIDYARELEKELENALGRKIKLVEGKKKGHIEIEFYGPQDREKLIENLRLFGSLRENK